MSDKRFTQEYEEAKQAAADAGQHEPRARSARYDRRANRIVVELGNGASFVFPPELAQGLAGASPEELASVEVTPSGSGLRWPSLDADFSLPKLLAGVFGTQSWMAALKRRQSGGVSGKEPPVRRSSRKSRRP